MKSYSISEQGLLKICRTLNKRYTFLSAPILIIIGSDVFITLTTIEFVLNIYKYIFILLFFGGILIFMIRRDLIQQKEIWQSIQINITEDYISRQQIRIPEVKIHKNEITSIQGSNVGLNILTSDNFQRITIPKQLDYDDYLEIKEILSTWKNIESVSLRQQITNFATVFGMLGAGLTLLISPFVLINVLIGMALISYYGYSIYSLQQSSIIDPKLSKNLTMSLIVIIIIVLANTLGKM